MFPHFRKKQYRIPERPKATTNRELRTIGALRYKGAGLQDQSPSSRMSNMSSPSLVKFSKPDHLNISPSRIREEVQEAEEEDEVKKRAEKIALRGRPKGLLLKQRKLLTAAKTST